MVEIFEAKYEGALQPSYFCAQGAMTMRKYYGIDHKLMLIKISEPHFAVWINRLEDMREVGNRLVEMFSDSDFMEKMKLLWEESEENLVKIFEKIDIIDLTRINDEELDKVYREFCDIYLDFWNQRKCINPLHFGLDETFYSLLEDELNQKNRLKEKSKIASILTYMTWKSFVNEENESLERIIDAVAKVPDAVKFTKENPLGFKQTILLDKEIREMLEDHSKRFFWIKNNYAFCYVLSSEDFAGIVVMEISRSENKRKAKELGEIAQEKELMIRETGFSDKILKIMKMMDFFAYLQDKRKKLNLIADYYLDLLLAEIGRRSGFELMEMKYLLPDETHLVLRGTQFSHEEINSRMKFCVIEYFCDEPPKIYTGKEAEKKLDEEYGQQEKLNLFQVFGTPASPGTAIGKARIIFSPSEIDLVQPGEILITSMTRPDLVPAMKKAGAIITDEGGITCHAAILSRELGVPCIVGTKVATKVFSNGDIVEVRANHGVARKLGS